MSRGHSSTGSGSQVVDLNTISPTSQKSSQLLWQRQRMAQPARARIMNQLWAVALNGGLRCKQELWRETGRNQLESFVLAP
jgi:hypothetical protein